MRFGGLFRERPLHESRAAVLGYRGLRTGAAKLGLDVLLRTFYSPVPHLDELPPGAFERVSDLPGVGWDLDAQARFLHERLVEPMAEFRPPRLASDGSPGYSIENPSYSLLDATIHYGMVRVLRPRRVIELGSGYSTLVTAEAAQRNAADGSQDRKSTRLNPVTDQSRMPSSA